MNCGIREADAGEFATDEQVKAAFAKWMDGDDPCLGPKPRRRIETAWRTGTVAVSAITS